jgi:hypothetical protein
MPRNSIPDPTWGGKDWSITSAKYIEPLSEPIRVPTALTWFNGDIPHDAVRSAAVNA